MKWKAKVLPDRRVLKIFLLIPRRIEGEWVWLETVYIYQHRLSNEWELDTCWITDKYTKIPPI